MHLPAGKPILVHKINKYLAKEPKMPKLGEEEVCCLLQQDPETWLGDDNHPTGLLLVKEGANLVAQVLSSSDVQKYDSLFIHKLPRALQQRVCKLEQGKLRQQRHSQPMAMSDAGSMRAKWRQQRRRR